MAKSLTGATAVIALSITGLYAAPQQLQGFAADDVFDTEAVEPNEVLMGVDGVLSAGYVNVPRKMGITLQGDSPSNDLFDNWVLASNALSDVYFANGLVSLTAVGKKYTLTNGVLTSYMPISAVKKLIQPRKYAITWESISPAAS